MRTFEERIEEVKTIKKIIKKMKASEDHFGIYYYDVQLWFFLNNDGKTISFEEDFNDGGRYNSGVGITNYDRGDYSADMRKASVLRLLDRELEHLIFRMNHEKNIVINN